MSIKIINESTNTEREYRDSIESMIEEIVGNRLSVSKEYYDYNDDDGHIRDIIWYKESNESTISYCFDEIEKNVS